MKPKLEQRLIEAYPDLYSGVGLSLTKSLMSFGFGCEDGWFNILDKLSKALTDLNIGVVATQVKEKYGTLRFYISSGSEEAFDLIDKAEEESGKICEVCGRPGKMRAARYLQAVNVGYWLRTLCTSHYTEWVKFYTWSRFVDKMGT